MLRAPRLATALLLLALMAGCNGDLFPLFGGLDARTPPDGSHDGSGQLDTAPVDSGEHDGSVPVPTNLCTRAADCSGSASVCGYSGACEAARCGLPAAHGDAGVASSVCDGTCTEGFVCVPTSYQLNAAQDAYELVSGASGRCFPACDPCQPSCTADWDCIQLETGGGFCHPPPLAREGQKCSTGVCAGERHCYVWGGNVYENFSECRKRCVPAATRTTEQDVTYALSDDCGDSGVCQYLGRPVLRDIWGCTPATLIDTGDHCIGGNKRCRPPEDCEFGTCSSNGCGGCPAGVGCYRVTRLDAAVADRCIRDGVLPAGGLCAQDRNCQAGLRCVTQSGNWKACRL